MGEIRRRVGRAPPPPGSVGLLAIAIFCATLLGLDTAAAGAQLDGSLVSPGLERLGDSGLGALDSLEIRDRAREAQARFERTRSRYFTWFRSRVSGECDEVVGRFCYWHEDDRGEPWKPPSEPPAVVRARAELLAALAEAERTLPGDGWIVGQRIRYLVESGRLEDARTAARGCRAERWWCRSLLAFALHASGRFADAEMEFDEALQTFPRETRERWTDVTMLLDDRSRSHYASLEGEARAKFERRFWALADPFYSTAGNERRTEHLARRVLDRMQEGARSGYGIRWGADLRELLVRYGWPIGWERVRRPMRSLGGGNRDGVMAHDPPHGRRFAPSHEMLTEGVSAETLWTLDVSKPRSTYAPPYAERVEDLDHQVALFRRRDHTVVVAGFDGSFDSLSSAVEGEAALVTVDLALDRRVAVASTDRVSRGGLSLATPGAIDVVSVEVRIPGRRQARRARIRLPGLGPGEGRPGVSDLLLLTGSDPLPESLPEAVSRVRASARVFPGERVGLFWEAYPPLGTPQVVRMAVALIDAEPGFWRRLGRLFRGRGSGRVELAWNEEIPAGTEWHPRSAALELPDLRTGEYTLELTVTWPDSRVLRANRRIEVVSSE